MSDYWRNVTYLGKYVDHEMIEKVGFAKLEYRRGSLRGNIKITDEKSRTAAWKAYIGHQEGGTLFLRLLGTLSKSGSEFILTVSEKSKNIEDKKLILLGRSGEYCSEETLKKYKIRTEESTEELKLVPISEPETQLKSESNIESKVPLKKEPSVDAKASLEPESNIESEVPLKTEPNIESKASLNLESNIESEVPLKKESKIDSKTSSKLETKLESETSSKPETKLESETPSKPETKLESETPPMLESLFKPDFLPESESNPKLGKEESLSSRPESSEDWVDKILKVSAGMYPFSDNDLTQCVRIEPKDFGMLPSKDWVLGSNSFLLNGYYSYRHILFGVKEENGEKDCYLGVPGIYHRREIFMAKMFGFSMFKGVQNKKTAAIGDFGYWMMQI